VPIARTTEGAERKDKIERKERGRGQTQKRTYRNESAKEAGYGDIRPKATEGQKKAKNGDAKADGALYDRQTQTRNIHKHKRHNKNTEKRRERK